MGSKCPNGKKVMYGGSLAYLTHFEMGGKYNRRKIHRYGRFGGGIEDLFLTVLITFFVILRISKNVIIFWAKKLWRPLPPHCPSHMVFPSLPVN